MIPDEAAHSGAHSPYMVTATGQLFCYAEGCDWTASEGGDDAIQTWTEHHKEQG